MNEDIESTDNAPIVDETSQKEHVLKTEQEIKERAMSFTGVEDYFASIRSILISFMGFENAAKVTGGKIEAQEHADIKADLTKEAIEKYIKDFIPNGFAAINNKQSFVARRNFESIMTLLWIYNDEDLTAQIENLPYIEYGKNIFRVIATKFGLNADAFN